MCRRRHAQRATTPSTHRATFQLSFPLPSPHHRVTALQKSDEVFLRPLDQLPVESMPPIRPLGSISIRTLTPAHSPGGSVACLHGQPSMTTQSVARHQLPRQGSERVEEAGAAARTSSAASVARAPSGSAPDQLMMRHHHGGAPAQAILVRTWDQLGHDEVDP